MYLHIQLLAITIWQKHHNCFSTKYRTRIFFLYTELQARSDLRNLLHKTQYLDAFLQNQPSLMYFFAVRLNEPLRSLWEK